MLTRLPVRTLSRAAFVLIAGFPGALFALDFAAEVAPAELLVQIGAAYLTWVVLALAVYGVIGRALPTPRKPQRPSDVPGPPDALEQAPLRESERP